MKAQQCVRAIGLLRLGGAVLMAAGCASICAAAAAQQPVAYSGAPVEIHIAAQALPDALKTLADQTGLQFAYEGEIDSRLIAPRISGTYSPEAALVQILGPSGLSHHYINDRTVAIGARPYGSEGNSDSGKQDQATQTTRLKSAGARAEPVSSRSEADTPTGLQEVLVTAQKRTENLLDVPASLTALSAETLDRQGVVSFSDYMTLVPSLSNFSEGAAGHGAIILRGLNTGYFQFSNTVGYYIDDTPFSATSPLSNGTFLTLDPDLSDVDHLEVLKGPQATLYGASTLGGLIKVVSKKPDLTSNGGNVRLEGSTIDGGGNGYGLAGAANFVVIPNELAIKVSGFDRDTPGYMQNLALGTKDRNVSRKEGGRLFLRWVPNENLEIDVNAFLQSLSVTGWSYEFVDLQTLAPLTGPYTYSLQYDPTFHTTYEVYNATINYKVGSVGTLTNSASYASYSDHEQEDYSPWYGAAYNLYAPAPVPASVAQPLLFSPSLNKLSDELRFTSQRVGGLEWLAGLFYTREQIGYSTYLYNSIPPSLQPIPGSTGNILSISEPASYKEEAAFADLTYYLDDSLDLTVGGRYSRNRQELTVCQSGFATTPGCAPNSSSDSDFTYLAALRWKPRAGLNTYARIATSYRPGGPQVIPLQGYPATFKPDSLVNYEVGVKADWLSGRLRTNLAVYDMKWKDVQMSSNIAGYLLISNGGQATVRGVELETQYAPTSHVNLGVNVAYTDAKLDSVSIPVSQITGAVPGDRLPFTPRWSASAVADYIQSLNATLTSDFGITYRYQGSKWSDYPGDALNTGVLVPHYNTFDVRAGLNWSRYQLQFRVANVFNEHGLDTVVDQRIQGNPPADAAVIAPRTYVLSLGVSL